MLSVRSIAEDIIAREGGYVNDPDDPGGPTQFGVTLHTLRALGLDLDRDGDIDTGDVQLVTRERAIALFVSEYFQRPRIGLLPAALQPSVFDMYVNAGSNAVRILQRLLRDMGQDLVVDGVIGPRTAHAAHRALADAPDHLVDAYGIARRNYYYQLGDRRPQSRKFARRRDGGKGGWITRAEEFIAPRWHLSEADHRARVAAWG
ncbi:holin-associated N-acetylmuramidase [uncultured Roseicyclus sp.]|jgi:lysozyme family protein|uniref:holin-associated N-acetylmuramidase n=1 Tax=uncultured Roseicyclus sp. TaxID=543072 RepID=UPI0026140919|nr:holin-associated N-acetylmuramidase [uncultured Roseicyclus sp.]